MIGDIESSAKADKFKGTIVQVPSLPEAIEGTVIKCG